GTGVGRHHSGVQCFDVNIHPCSGLDDVDDDEANDQSYGADDLEVDQRQTAGGADLLQVCCTCDPENYCDEDHGRNHHPDQLDETVAERLHHGRRAWGQNAQRDTDCDCHQHLDVERPHLSTG